MDRILIVGSGASGVHFALSVLRKGHHVTMLDVGRKRPEIYNVTGSYRDLKTNLSDPVRYFLGEKYEAVVFPGAQEEYYTKYYGFPPSKGHVFSLPQTFLYEAKGMIPLISFAQGGLAQACRPCLLSLWLSVQRHFRDRLFQVFRVPISFF